MLEGKKRGPALLYGMIAALAIVFAGLVVYAYMGTGKPTWKMILGTTVYVSWIALTYLATRPKWLSAHFDMARVRKFHWVVGSISLVMLLVHWYAYFWKAVNMPLGFFGGYISLVSFFAATAAGVVLLRSNARDRMRRAVGRRAIWLHRLNFVALAAAIVHVHDFKRLVGSTPFIVTYDALGMAVLLYYMAWMLRGHKRKKA